jgi:hypothetical protein
MFLYKLSAKAIQLGLDFDSFSCSDIIHPSSHTNQFAINLADTIIIIHITQKATNLIHFFIDSSLSDVIIS